MRAERKERNLSQEEVAHRAGVSLRTYNALERGEALDPHYSTLRSIADALGVSVATLAEEIALAGKA
jgi:transcriptional regulator with XRE-family HTH domain